MHFQRHMGGEIQRESAPSRRAEYSLAASALRAFTRLAGSHLRAFALLLLLLFATGCANCRTVTEQREYDPSGRIVLKEYKQTTETFSQGWSNGSGKTVDVHPQVDLLNM